MDLLILIKRNIKVFLKDKGLILTAFITPLILLILYATFLGNVYKESFTNILNAFNVSDKLINSLVAGQLLSSLIVVCSLTVAITCNNTQVLDKITGAKKDYYMTPLKKYKLSLSYFFATFIATFFICLIALIACIIYISIIGEAYSFKDIILLIFDVFLFSLFGTALATIINTFIKTQGQIQAVSAIISAGYGFICGAYMPIYSFSKSLQKILSFLPFTYNTILSRNHALNPFIDKLDLPDELINGLKESCDVNFKFFDNVVKINHMYIIITSTIILLIIIYLLINILRKRKI